MNNIGYASQGGSVYDQSLQGFWAKSQSAIKDNKSRSIMASRSRILYEGSSIGRSLIDRITGGAVGSGLYYSPLPNSKYFENYSGITNFLTDSMELYSNAHAFDTSGRWTLMELQRAAFHNMILSGDVFLVRNRKKGFSSWRIREEFSCKTPRCYEGRRDLRGLVRLENGNYIIDGVEIRKLKPVAYYFTDTPFMEDANFVRIPAYDADGFPIVLHAAFTNRADEYRGIPVMAPVIENVWSSLAYTKAETQAAIIEACNVFAVTTNTVNNTINPFSQLTQEQLDKPLAPQNSDDFQLDPLGGLQNQWFSGAVKAANYVTPGQSIHLAPGEDVKSIDTKRPNSGYAAFIDAQIMLMGAAIGIPKQILSQNFDATYSSAKAAVVQYKRTCEQFRRRFVESVIKPMFSVFCRDMIMQSDPYHGREIAKQRAPLLALESVWRCKESPLVLDPTKELDYYLRAVEAGFITRDEAAQMLFGHDAVGGSNETV
jgi:lambda family phage portal protein